MAKNASAVLDESIPPQLCETRRQWEPDVYHQTVSVPRRLDHGIRVKEIWRFIPPPGYSYKHDQISVRNSSQCLVQQSSSVAVLYPSVCIKFLPMTNILGSISWEEEFTSNRGLLTQGSCKARRAVSHFVALTRQLINHSETKG